MRFGILMQAALRVGLLALTTLTLPLAFAADDAPRAATASGLLEGARSDGLDVFRGVPFAAPPVGALRWRAPQPVQPWRGVRSAAAFGTACPQKSGLSLEGGGDPGRLSEDCLYVNVWTPRAAPGAKLPVMVWLHGGALIFGAGSLKLYDGASLAQQGVVVVTVNYRLGPLGYFVHPALERAAPRGPANFGLLDQMAALRWVQRNIEAFGGDARQVTVFGQSAGAQSVLALMASPLSRGLPGGLFQRAVAQSPYGIPSHSREQARQTGVRVASALGLAGERATLAQLRRVPAESFANLQGPDLSLAPGIIIGDAALPQPILAVFQAQQQAKVPLIIGSNSDESSVAVVMGLDPAALVKKLGAARILVRPMYPGVTDEGELGRQVVRDVGFTAFSRRIAVLHSKTTPTWRYYFSFVPQQARALKAGAAHGDEVTAVFGTGDLCACLPTPLTDTDREVGRQMAARWVAFAKVGDPGVAATASTPRWPPDSRYRPVVLEFGEQQTLQTDFMKNRLNTFIGVLNLVGRGQARN